MADRRLRVAAPAPSTAGTITASAYPTTLLAAGPPGDGYYGASSGLEGGKAAQAWGYYHANGPLTYGINWLAGAMSRVALTIAEVLPGVKEPIPVDKGPAVDILAQVKWDESQILRDLALQVSVPGRGYLVGRDDVDGVPEWCVYSSSQVRPVRRGNGTYELREYGGKWEPLDNALVVVIRDSDPQFRWLDTSTVQSALTVLREIDLYDRDIVSSLVSRISNNGILLVPTEVSFPAREGYKDSEDPFMLNLIEVAQQSIKDPGSASASIPMPIKVPAQFIDKFRHLILSNPVDAKVFDARREAYSILAETVNLPKEIMTGMSDVNHSAGLAEDLDQSAITMHISPVAELITRQFTSGFLRPQLRANSESLTGPNGGRLIVSFDTSALAARPDNSESAVQLYDRLELSGEAVRREAGFSEDDAPTIPEVREQALKKMIGQAQVSLSALAELTGSELVTQSPVGTDDVTPQSSDPDDDGAPQNAVAPIAVPDAGGQA